MTCGSKWGVENNFLSVTLHNFPLPLRKPCVGANHGDLVRGVGGGGGGRWSLPRKCMHKDSVRKKIHASTFEPKKVLQGNETNFHNM